MKWLARILLALVILVAIVFAIGWMLPRDHTAAVRITLAASPDSVYAAISDVARSADWRKDVSRVEIVREDPLTWRETAGWGRLTFVRDVAEPPRVLVHRIEDTGEPFGGTWTFELSPEGGGTAVRITEEGWVANPLFRVLSRYFFGHYTVLETYARDLGRRFGEVVEPARVR